MSRSNLPARPAYESLIESLKSQRRAVGRQLAGSLVLHPKFLDALLEEHARRATFEAKRDAVPPAAAVPAELTSALARMDECRAGCDAGDPFYADPRAWDIVRVHLAKQLATQESGA